MASSCDSSSAEYSKRTSEYCCYQDWMKLQESSLSELLQGLQIEAHGDDGDFKKEEALRQLVEKNMKHFEEYAEKRSKLAQSDVSPYFAPTWCSSLESSLLWLAGCRPSLFIRLLYAVSGLQFEAQLTQFLNGVETGNLGDLSADQIVMIDDLQRRTVKEERKLSETMASLQEDIAEPPIAETAGGGSEMMISDEAEMEVADAIIEHETLMVGLLEEADKLRLSALRKLIEILSPVQAVDYLAASKKLHLCVHKWGTKKDEIHGRI